MTDELQAVVAAIEAGEIGKARFLLRPLLANPTADILVVAAQVAPNKDEARKRLLEALELDPDHEGAKAELSRVEVKQATVHLPGGVNVEERQMSPFAAMQSPGIPKLPGIPKSLAGYIYKPSGKFSPLYILLVLLIGVPAAIALGFIIHTLGLVIVVPVIAIIRGGLTTIAQAGRVSLGGIYAVFYLILAFGYVLVFYPAAAGRLTGYLLWAFAKSGKCRNVGLATIVSFLLAALVYGTFIFFGAQPDGVFYSSLNVNYTPIGVYAALVIGALIFAYMSLPFVRHQIENTPFSENTGTWYGANWQQVRIDTSAAPFILNAIITGSLQGLQEVPRVSTNHYPYLDVRLREHPTSKLEDVQLHVTIFWKEVSFGPRGRRSTKEHDVWLNMMLPAELGHKLQYALFHIGQRVAT